MPAWQVPCTTLDLRVKSFTFCNNNITVMSVDIMTEADTRFIADNMLTADDFDLSESLDISALAKLSQELQLYKQCLPEFYAGSDGEQSVKGLCGSLRNDYSFMTSEPELIFDEISCDITCDTACDIKVEPLSSNPSPGSTSGYSSQGSWNEEFSVTEIDLVDNDLVESPPSTPPAFSSSVVSPVCVQSLPVQKGRVPLTLPAQPLAFSSGQITSVHQAKLPIQKVKSSNREIQPKAVKRKLQPCNTIIRSSPPLILTPEEFSQLTASSVHVQQTPILISPQQTQPFQQPVEVNRNTNILPSFKSEVISHTSDTKTVKKQQRMIRNRESAFLSRKKRREYVQNLEQHLSDLNQEKNRLLTENIQLKERIKTLELENNKLKTIFPSVNVKKTTTCLMAVLFMFTLNMAPFSGLMSGSNTVARVPAASVNRYGRSLLWTEIKDPGNLPLSLGEDLVENLQTFKAPTLKNSSSCPTFVNKTESLRLEKELRGWALRVEKQKEKPSLQKLRKKLLIPMPKLHTLFHAGVQKHPNDVGLDVYNSPRFLYEELFEALERKDDTFYFVSFSGDHLLLPASAHNRTQRPKMSLVMPAMTLNETTKRDQVTMMQIDCEVMNMHLVQVKESVIPLHLRHKLSDSTQAQNTVHNSSSSQPTRSQNNQPTLSRRRNT